MTSNETNVPAVFTAGTLTPTFRYDLLDVDDQVLGSIDGVVDGSLQWSSATAVKAGGSLEIVDLDGIDWLHARVQVWRSVGGFEWSRGIYVPSAPQDRWTGGVRSWTVELLGKLTLLDQDEQAQWVSVPAGTVITSAVRDLLLAAGHTRLAITDSDATLRSGMTWEPGTTLLRIINDLLEAAGYWSLTADGLGRFVAEPYVRPAARPPRYGFFDDERGLYVDDFTRDQDVYSIPNRFVAIGAATSDLPPLISVAENNDPTSPYSIVSRGRVITQTEDSVEAADQKVLDAYVRRRLIERSSVSASLVINHAPLPLDLNDAVQFRRVPAGIDALHTVQSMTEPLNANDLITTTLREVVDL